MIKCQACGTQNLESSQYCDECGDSLNKYRAPEASEVQVDESADVSSGSQPVFQSANVTSVGIPPVSEKPVEKKSNDDEEESLDRNAGDATPKKVGVHANLVIERGSAMGTEFSLSADESNIGRWDADNGIFPDVDLDSHDPEAKVSRKHARIVLRGNEYFLEDLGSTNGTFVNRGRRLIPGNPQQLREGDEIIVGKTFLRFHIVQ